MKIKFWVVGAVCISISLFLAGKSFSQQSDYSGRLQFSSTAGVFKFYDSQTGKIYKYSEADGSLIKVWVLTNLGGNLQEETQTQSIFEY